MRNWEELYRACRLCPRKCGTDRSSTAGACGMTGKIFAAKASLHKWEEPCISSKNGAGTVFFSGCSLRCCFCQNYKISSRSFGAEISPERLGQIFLTLQEEGADNIDLVTPTHFVPSILRALDLVKGRLRIPVVYNSSGYELPETIALLEGYVDVFLPDLKYLSSELSARYSGAPDYFERASKAVLAMTDQAGELVFDGEGKLLKGTVIRHLVLPGCRKDSMEIMRWIARSIPPEKALVSIMDQYTPFPHLPESFPELRRRVTKMEYNRVVDLAAELGLKGYTQEKSSASESYVPNFDLSGII
ncbi:MAG: radical SAM protein [Ruminococcus sp.]|nr:radical SAM protein [Ruminococcus sp.]